MEERVYKENLKRMILEMAQDEISNYSSQKGVQKYFEGNIDKIINENIMAKNGESLFSIEASARTRWSIA